jgi:hypothetical protein
MIEWCEHDSQAAGFYTLEAITGHRKNHKAGRGYDVEILWGDGTTS